MLEPNPAKADYTCIKFLKIAVFFNTTFAAVEMQQKQLTKHKPPKLCLCCNKGVETSERNEACL